MTLSTQDTHSNRTSKKPLNLGRDDPLLQELWAAKARLNAAAGYRVETLAQRAREFDLEATLSRLQEKIQH